MSHGNPGSLNVSGMGRLAGSIHAGHAAGFENPWPVAKQRAMLRNWAASGSMFSSVEPGATQRRTRRAKSRIAASARVSARPAIVARGATDSDKPESPGEEERQVAPAVSPLLELHLADARAIVDAHLGEAAAQLLDGLDLDFLA